MKIAASLDGRTALDDGRSQWITGPAARRDGHAWRRRAGAILTGIGTVLADDPRLDVRDVPTAKQPLRVVVDARADLSAGARIVQPPGVLRVYTLDDRGRRCPALAQRGCPGGCGARDCRAGSTWTMCCATWPRIGVNELHVEAGPRLNGSLLAAGRGRRTAGLPGSDVHRPGPCMAELPPLAGPGLAAGRFTFFDSTPDGRRPAPARAPRVCLTSGRSMGTVPTCGRPPAIDALPRWRELLGGVAARPV
jgi:diaminohydroxyphosphoribosylaminopyrimidine deaminase/5-amino-6-(5-phosphoribosylamino)uracil reductase